MINNKTAGFLLAAAANSVQADVIDDPYVMTNRSPFVQIYGLPAAQSAKLATAGTSRTGLQLDISNNFTEDNKSSEAIFIDGETHRANIQFRYGLNDAIELGIDLPYLSHDSGSLDSLIEDWHDLFGFPDAGRPEFPRDQLQFTYVRDGQVLSRVASSNDGIGDVSLSMGYQLSQTETRQWALRTAVKLPTGDADDLHGSESTDVSLGLNVSDQGLLQKYNIILHASAGAMWMGGGEVVEELQEDFVLYGSSTLSWQVTSSVSLKIQLDAHTAFYDSALTELGNDSAQLILGGAVRLGERWVLDLAVSEDIAVDTAPDMVLHIGIKAIEF
ncbi:MAG: DUF3187 family protein [Oceanicoccus sp.]|uniref:DUF3187 family protein n=1 Tax=Oceanicoccus sp. TaxID=2691044 RepID=UPI0026313ED4|nr:DUF3187 family protein [Oceanicoccus sp.]MCP3908263.1 DUF3187 family protein [Oceanicoccus sp.]